MTTAAILVTDAGASLSAVAQPHLLPADPGLFGRPPPPVRTGSVVTLAHKGRSYASVHEQATRAAFAERLANLIGFDYCGEYDAAQRYTRPLYFVPNDTIAGIGEAEALGITGQHDLFGGVVPHPFVLTKAITHPLVHAGAARPVGWSEEFSSRVAGAVLTGFSAFSRADALAAGDALLRSGAVRVKPVHATGGRGQSVANDAAALARCLDAMEDSELAEHGVVLEENLTDLVTFSVGQVTVDGLTVSYHGTQCMTQDSRGEAVYGGSDLWLVRGGFDALLATQPSSDVRIAVDQALVYHGAVAECFGGFFTSRLNYDVVCGLGALGQRRSGVLEQSWRVGGATGAEIAALELFRAEPRRDRTNVRCVEAYGEDFRPPAGAGIYYRGMVPDIGMLTKYTLIDPEC